MRIRTASMADLDAVTAVEAVCFPPTEAASRAEFANRLAVYPNHFWLLEEDDGTLVGFCLLYTSSPQIVCWGLPMTPPGGEDHLNKSEDHVLSYNISFISLGCAKNQVNCCLLYTSCRDMRQQFSHRLFRLAAYRRIRGVSLQTAARDHRSWLLGAYATEIHGYPQKSAKRCLGKAPSPDGIGLLQ